MRSKIHQLLVELRLNGVTDALDRELDKAQKAGTSVSEVIYRLLMEEHASRQQMRLGKSLRDS